MQQNNAEVESLRHSFKEWALDTTESKQDNGNDSIHQNENNDNDLVQQQGSKENERKLNANKPPISMPSMCFIAFFFFFFFF